MPLPEPAPAAPEYSIPPAPAWAGDFISYGAALDAWLAQLRGLSEDPAWLAWYRRMYGPLGESLELPPYPPRGDKEGWAQWWQNFNAIWAQRDTSFGGIFPEEQRPSPGERRNLSHEEIEELIRDVIADEVPAVFDFLLGRATHEPQG
jgi:hypothetical protein